MRTDVLLVGAGAATATVTPTIVAGLAAVGSPSVATGSRVSAVQVSGVAAVPAPTVTADAPTFTDGRDVTTENVGYAPTGVTLTEYTGSTTITTDGTTIDSKQINVRLTINADNVTITRCLIVAGPGSETSSSGLVIGGANILIEDTELRSVAGSNPDDGYTAAQDRAVAYWTDGPVTFRRCYIHGTRRFIGFYSGSNLTIEDSYIGDNVNDSEGHTSGIGAWGGTSYFILRRCRFRGPMDAFASGCVQCYPMSAANHHWTIEKNWLSTSGGALMTFGYTTPTESPNYDITIQDNFFGDATYTGTDVAWNQVNTSGTKLREAFTLPDGSNVWSNNRDYVSGDLIGQPT